MKIKGYFHEAGLSENVACAASAAGLRALDYQPTVLPFLRESSSQMRMGTLQ
jgi:hypothetical protein